MSKSIKKSDTKAVKIFLISTTFVIFALLGFMIFLLNKSSDKSSILTNESLTEEDGKQVINITAKGGFSPNYIIARSEKPTILKIRTENTIDCTSSLSIPKLSYNKLLPLTGTTEIEIPEQNSGEEIYGTCNIGLYHFTLKFV